MSAHAADLHHHDYVRGLHAATDMLCQAEQLAEFVFRSRVRVLLCPFQTKQSSAEDINGWQGSAPNRLKRMR